MSAPDKRERWNSRGAFIMAAVGSAVGLGNLWRFPFVAYDNGGGAFLIPYFVAMLTAGVPMLILEFGLGHIMQGSAPHAAMRVNKRLEWVGWWALMVASMIVIYYAVVMAWCWVYTWHSLSALTQKTASAVTAKVQYSGLPWGNELASVEEFFYGRVLRLLEDPGAQGGLAWPVVIGLGVTWLWIYWIIYRGVHRVGKVVMWTVPLPVILLIVLLIRGLTLDGSLRGLAFYLTPNFEKLKEPSVWLAAYSQVFFSLSLGFGILIAYASYLPRTTDVNNSAFITAFADWGISFLAGFAVFSVLGYLAFGLNIPVEKVVRGGPTLTFVIYPLAISQMPFLPELFGLIFFITLLTLGIDSAFSLVEGVVSGVNDKWGIRRSLATGAFCIGAFLIG